MPVDPQRLKELFLTASELPSAAERAALLDRECGADTELRRRLEALLRAHDDSGGFLAGQADRLGATVDPAAGQGEGGGEAVGTVLGPYKLLQKLGEGGMGTVWVAEQLRPIKRRVALKVIKPGLDSAQVLRRFEAERQALALMDHTHIARVFDAGSTDTGRPYFVMELVHGIPMTRYCDELNLPVRERLELFVPVCQAIQHAHQKGIIHRDIKPSNVLVCMQDGKPAAKVIDFGVAKAMNQRLTEETMCTEFGAVVGTLEYMAPEQAEMSPLGVDTRADVYALGVLLYELLTGTTPLDRPRLKKAGFLEMLRLIKEEEPPRPSTRLSDSREKLPDVAARRRTLPARLRREVRGELDWIAMKCLEKDRTRRYESAIDLGRDVERYLAGEVVEACPPSAGYRLRRLLYRHRLAFGVAALIAVVLLLATAVSATQAVRARIAEERAREEGDRAEDLAHTEAAASLRAREQAQLATERAETLAHQLYISRVNLAHREAMADNVAGADALLEDCEAGRRGWEWTYSKRLCHLEARTLVRPTGPSAAVDAVACSPDGRRIAAAYVDGTIGIWDVGSGNLLRSLEGHGGAISSIAFDEGGRRLISGGWDGTVRLWDVEAGVQKTVLWKHHRAVTSVAFRPGADQAAAGVFAPLESLRNGQVEIKQWDLATGRAIRTLYHRNAFCQTSVAFSPDGRRLVSSTCWGGWVRVWDADKGTETAAFRGPDNSSGAESSLGLAVSPADGRIAFSGSYNAVFLWGPPSSGDVQYFRGHTGQIRALAFRPDGRWLASASDDGTLKVWRTADGRQEKHLRGHIGVVNAVAFLPDGRGLVSGGGDGTVKLWDLSPGRDPYPLRLGGWGRRVRFAPAGGRTAISGFWGVIVSGGAGGGPGFEIPQQEGAGGVVGLDYSRDGRLLATCCEGSNQAYIWDAETGRPVVRCQGHVGRVRNVAFGPGNLLASAGDDGTVRTWGAATGRAERVIEAHKGGAFGVAFDPAGTIMATIGWDGAVRLWEARTGEPIRTLGSTLQRRSILYGDALAFDPTGRRLAAASDDGLVHVWEVATAREVLTLRGHSQEVHSVAYSPDGRRLATSAEDRTIKLWDAATGEEVFTLRGHLGGILGMAFSRDGSRILSTGADNQVLAWDGSPAPGTRKDLDEGEAADVSVARAKAHAQKGQTNEAAASFLEAFHRTADRAGRARIITEAAAWKGVLEKLGEQAAGDGPIQAELARRYAAQGNAPLADAARARARTLFERQLAAEPDNAVLASDLSDLLWSTLAPFGYFWIDDAAPPGANLLGDTPWEFVSRPNHPVFRGKKSIRRQARGQSQHFFEDAAPGLKIGDGAHLFAHVFLDPRDPPKTVMLQFRTTTGSWAHRAVWGANLIPWGEPGTESHLHMGPLPKAGAWIRLEVDPSKVGLSPGSVVDGWAFTQVDGTCYWDAAGITDSFDTPWQKLAAAYHRLGDQKALERLLERHPAAAAGVADLYAADQDWKRVIAEYRKALAAQPADGDLLTRLATAYQLSGRTREAVAQLAKVSAANPKDMILALKVAVLQAWFGQEKDLAATRQRTLAAARDTEDVVTAERAAKLCSILPANDKAVLEAALAHGRTAVKLGQGGLFQEWRLLALGMAEYRSGHYAAADEALRAAVEAGKNTPSVLGTASFYRAMSLFQLGKAGEARKLARAAAAKMKPLPADDQNPLAGDANHDSLILWLASKEAKALLQLDAAPPAKNDRQ